MSYARGIAVVGLLGSRGLGLAHVDLPVAAEGERGGLEVLLFGEEENKRAGLSGVLGGDVEIEDGRDGVGHFPEIRGAFSLVRMRLVDGHNQVGGFVVPRKVCRAPGLRLGGSWDHGGRLLRRRSCGRRRWSGGFRWRRWWWVTAGMRRRRGRRTGLNSLGNSHSDSMGVGLIDGMGLGYVGSVGHSSRLGDGHSGSVGDIGSLSDSYGGSVGDIGSLCLGDGHTSSLVVSYLNGMSLGDIAGAMWATSIRSQGDILTAGDLVLVRLGVDVISAAGIAGDELGAALVLQHAI